MFRGNNGRTVLLFLRKRRGRKIDWDGECKSWVVWRNRVYMLECIEEQRGTSILRVDKSNLYGIWKLIVCLDLIQQ